MTADTALLEAERALLAKVQSGERLELSPRDPRDSRTIRAEVLRGFFHDPPGGGANGGANGAWDEVPVWISNAYIEGELDLSDLRRAGWGSLRALYLQDCEIPARLKFRNARFRRLSLRGCAIHHLDARDCRFEALLDLRGLHSAGAVLGALGQPLCHVELTNCRIDGDLWAEGASFCGPAQTPASGASVQRSASTPYALDLRGAEVLGSVRLESRVRADGGVTLDEARIAGGVWMRGARLTAAHGAAFRAQNARIESALVGRCWEFASGGGRPHREPLCAKGEVQLTGAHIGGGLDLRGAIVARGPGPEDGHSDGHPHGRLVGSGARIGGSAQLGVWSDDGLIAAFQNGVRLDGAEIDGDLDLTGAQLGKDAHGCSLSLQGAVIKQSLRMGCWASRDRTWRRFRAAGATRLGIARIAGDLVLAGGAFDEIDASDLTLGGDLKGGPPDHDDGLTLEAAEVGTFAEAAPALEVRGPFRLAGAAIEKRLCLSAARLDHVVAHDLAVAGRIDLRGAHLVSRLDFRRVRARGRLSLAGVKLITRPGRSGAPESPKLQFAELILDGVLEARGLERLFQAPGRGPAPLKELPGALRSARTASASDPEARARLVFLSALEKPARDGGAIPSVDLTGAQVDILDDDIGLGWGEVALILDGFRYRGTHRRSDLRPQARQAVKHRLNWLEQRFEGVGPSVSTCRSQGYVQLADVYRAEGRRAEAMLIIRRKIEVEHKLAAQRLERSGLRILLPLFGIYDVGFRYGFGYGVDAGRSLRTLAICILIGVSGAMYANRHGLLTVDAAPGVSRVGGQTARCGADVAPPLYAFDLFLPQGNLRQQVRQQGRCAIRPFEAADARRLERGRAEIEGLWRRLPKPEVAALPKSAGRYAGTYAGAMLQVARIWLAMRLGDPRVWLWAKTIYSFLGGLVVCLTLLTVAGILRRNAEQ